VLTSVDGKDAVVISGTTGAPISGDASSRQTEMIAPTLEDMAKALGKKRRALILAELESKRASERKKALQDELNVMVDEMSTRYGGDGGVQTALPLTTDQTAEKPTKKERKKKVKPPEPGSEPLAPTMADAVAAAAVDAATDAEKPEGGDATGTTLPSGGETATAEIADEAKPIGSGTGVRGIIEIDTEGDDEEPEE
jgi:hypothetical protein